MTNEEAQIVIGNIPLKPEVLDDCYSITDYQEAKAMAIEALSSSGKPNKWISAEVLDKIRAEIDQYLFQNEFGSAYRQEVSQIIDKYKAEGSEE